MVPVYSKNYLVSFIRPNPDLYGKHYPLKINFTYSIQLQCYGHCCPIPPYTLHLLCTQEIYWMPMQYMAFQNLLKLSLHLLQQVALLFQGQGPWFMPLFVYCLRSQSQKPCKSCILSCLDSVPAVFQSFSLTLLKAYISSR